MTELLIAAVVFFAALAQTLSGFGFALILMPVATILIGLRAAAPLVALTALTSYTVNLIRYRRAVKVRQVLRLGAASALGVPLGLWALVNVEESIIKPALGLVLIAYAIYRLARRAELRPCSPLWVYPAGFLAGCLGGAYNTPGPPVIIYGSLRQWPRDEFRAVLQTFFFFNGALVAASHYLARHLTPTVLTFYLYAAPALFLGILVGSSVDSKLNHGQFRAIVTAMILLLGLSLLLGLGKH